MKATLLLFVQFSRWWLRGFADESTINRQYVATIELHITWLHRSSGEISLNQQFNRFVLSYIEIFIAEMSELTSIDSALEERLRLVNDRSSPVLGLSNQTSSCASWPQIRYIISPVLVVVIILPKPVSAGFNYCSVNEWSLCDEMIALGFSSFQQLSAQLVCFHSSFQACGITLLGSSCVTYKY